VFYFPILTARVASRFCWVQSVRMRSQPTWRVVMEMGQPGRCEEARAGRPGPRRGVPKSGSVEGRLTDRSLDPERDGFDDPECKRLDDSGGSCFDHPELNRLDHRHRLDPWDNRKVDECDESGWDKFDNLDFGRFTISKGMSVTIRVGQVR
jgi:hypothetical protein